MAEGDCTVYNNTKEQIHLALLDFAGDTFKIILLGAGYALDPDGNPNYAAVVGDEITAAGYSAGGETLTALTITQDDANDRASWDAADITWISLGITVVDHAIIYDDTPTAAPAADPLMCHFEVATDPNGGNYAISFHANGIWLLS